MSKKKKILICVAVILLSIFTLTRIEYTNRVKDTNYTAFLEEVKDGNVEKITLYVYLQRQRWGRIFRS